MILCSADVHSSLWATSWIFRVWRSPSARPPASGSAWCSLWPSAFQRRTPAGDTEGEWTSGRARRQKSERRSTCWGLSLPSTTSMKSSSETVKVTSALDAPLCRAPRPVFRSMAAGQTNIIWVSSCVYIALKETLDGNTKMCINA